MFNRVYEFLLIFKEYVLLAVLVILSLFLLSLNDNVQIKRVRTISTVALSVFQRQVSFIPRYFSLRSENDILRELNMKLADEVNQLREAKLENFRLQRLLEMKEQSPFKYVSAKVSGRNFNLFRNIITLNVGSADGIAPRMTVVNERGVIGLVSEVTEHYCVVTTMLNIDFRASAKVQRSRVDGIVGWDGSCLLLRNVAKTLDVRTGDALITSEYSSTFPVGLKIGVVNSVRDEPGTLFKFVQVTPSVDFVKLEEVFVITQVPPEEKEKVEKSRK